MKLLALCVTVAYEQYLQKYVTIFSIKNIFLGWNLPGGILTEQEKCEKNLNLILYQEMNTIETEKTLLESICINT